MITLKSSTTMSSFLLIDKEGITTVIHMGDNLDSRKGIEFKSLKWSKRVVFNFQRTWYQDTMVGNHDATIRTRMK